MVFNFGAGASTLDVAEHPTVAHMRRFLEIPAREWIFREGVQTHDNVVTKHEDIYVVMKYSKDAGTCPKCARATGIMPLRMCMSCNDVGCEECVGDRCPSCFPDCNVVCRALGHSNKAALAASTAFKKQ